MQRIVYLIIIALIILLAQGSSFAASTLAKSGETIKGVQAEGACAIVGMSAEQSQLTALQRARATAIEQAAGVSVTSSTLVTNYAVTADFIKTYARGFIIKEKVAWLPLGQYRKDESVAPIFEYRVKIIADVYVPKKKAQSVGLKAKLNNTVFRSGEKVRFFLKAGKSARFAIFNIMADDQVLMIFPNIHESNNLLSQGKEITYPSKDSKIELEVQTLPHHKRDAEAYLVVYWDSADDIRIMELFSATETMSVSQFFERFVDIADACEEIILLYEVVGHTNDLVK